MDERSNAPVTVAICTRERPDMVCRPVSAVANGTFTNVRIVVIDQSKSEATRRALEPFLRDPRITYHHSHETGVARARNVAIGLCTSPLLLFTDDDCEPEPEWVERMVAESACLAEPFVIFGPLVPAASNTAVGMIPSWIPAARSVRSSPLMRCLGGVTANAALSREARKAVGLFNVNLGRGTPRAGGEDYEYAVRLLQKGGRVIEVTSPIVYHHGLVPPERIRSWLSADLRACGWLLGQQVRQRNQYAVPQFVFLVGGELRVAMRRLLRFRRPRRLSRVAWLGQGFVEGLLDRHRAVASEADPGSAKPCSACRPELIGKESVP